MTIENTDNRMDTTPEGEQQPQKGQQTKVQVTPSTTQSDAETELQKRKRKEKELAMTASSTIEEVKELIATHGQSKIQEALDKYFKTEKILRLAGQGESTTKIVVEIIRLCADCEQWDLLNDQILVLNKKRNQIKQAVTRMVQTAMEYLDKTPSRDAKIKLINTLRQVSEGKIYVEMELANLVKILSLMKEQEGAIDEAATLIQTIQVETIGSMRHEEKIAYILLQMRLCLDNKDYIRANILSKKITNRSISSPKQVELKIRYYNLMIRYYLFKREWLSAAQSYNQIYQSLKEKHESVWNEHLTNLVFYVILAPYDHEQSDLLHRIAGEKNLEESCVATERELINHFVKNELIEWPVFKTRFAPFIAKPAYAAETKDLHARVTEHNLRVANTFYANISIRRLAQLLHLSEDDTESFISKMVQNKTINAKIDRIDGVVSFRQTKSKNELLNDWHADIASVLRLVEKTNLLIHKERMVHAQYASQH